MPSISSEGRLLGISGAVETAGVRLCSVLIVVGELEAVIIEPSLLSMGNLPRGVRVGNSDSLGALLGTSD